MTLQNLLRIGRLKAHTVTAVEIRQLLAAVERNLADAAVAQVSDETRFDAAAMLAAGYRPSTSEPGHHVTLIQSLPLTLGVANEAWIVLDALRRKRNANDYTGDVVTPDMVDECAAQAKSLQMALRKHLKKNQAALLRG